MPTQAKEFLVANSVTGESGTLTVVGTGGDAEIPLGTRFTRMYRNKKRHYPDEIENPAVREVEESVDLLVAESNAYGRSMDFLPGSTSGCLRFSGTNTTFPAPGWILTTLMTHVSVF